MFSSPSSPLLSQMAFLFEKKRRAGDRRGKTTSSLLHSLHLSTVGFNSAIVLPLTLLAALMPTTMLL